METPLGPTGEVGGFLAGLPPFNRLPPAVVAETAAVVEAARFPRGRIILAMRGEPARHLYVIRSGAVDLLRDDSTAADVVDTLGPGESFAHPSLVSGRAPILSARAREETEVYLIPREQFERLRAHPVFEAHFVAGLWERLERALRLSRERAPLDLFGTRCSSLIRRPPVTCEPGESVREAAQRMAHEGVSSIIVATEPLGILTDRDLRNRVLGGAVPPEAPVHRVMSQPTITLPADSLLFEALLVMVERSIHHLPLTQGGRVVGVITDTDILRHQSSSPVFLRRQLDRARTDADFAEYARLVTDTVHSLLGSGARASDISRVVTVAHDSLMRRLLGDLEGELGPPPAPYAFVVGGSEGRLEQAIRTDQDSGLVWAEPPSAAPAERREIAAYFARFGGRAVERLEAAGFPPCPDGLTAANPDWRAPLDDWQGRYTAWIERPDPAVLGRVVLFFDLRGVHGALDVESALRPAMLRARTARRFLTALARGALAKRPPLGFFRRFALDRGVFDSLDRGITPIVRLARLAALEAGSGETNTIARLRAAAGAGSLGADEADELIAAFELLSLVRLRQQIAQVRRGERPHDHIRPAVLSDALRRDLRHAFLAVESAQRGLEARYPGALVG